MTTRNSSIGQVVAQQNMFGSLKIEMSFCNIMHLHVFNHLNSFFSLGKREHSRGDYASSDKGLSFFSYQEFAFGC